MTSGSRVREADGEVHTVQTKEDLVDRVMLNRPPIRFRVVQHTHFLAWSLPFLDREQRDMRCLDEETIVIGFLKPDELGRRAQWYPASLAHSL